MKKSIIISIIIFLVMSIFMGSVNAASATVNVRASNATPKVGDTITITVSFSVPVGTASLNLNYNSSIVQYVSSNAWRANNSGSSVKLDYLDADFQNKTITSMTVTFKVIAEGTANFTVSNTVLSDVNANELTANIGGSATITSKNETNNQTQTTTKPNTSSTATKPSTSTNPNTNTTTNSNQTQNTDINSTIGNIVPTENNNENTENENNNQINDVSSTEQVQNNDINEINQSEENKTNYSAYLIIAVVAIAIIVVIVIICKVKNND